MRKVIKIMATLALAIYLLTSLSTLTFAEGNTSNPSFSKAKRLLEDKVYIAPIPRETIYCQGTFDDNKDIVPPEGFYTEKYIKRAGRLEWEHVVPAENFGQTFEEWRDGDPLCVDNKGKAFKGRNCAEKVNEEYRFMQADMYNLYPAIGAVNAMRSNYNFTMLPHASSSFGQCLMKIDDRKAEPPVASRGKIARAYLYMESAYPRYSMSSGQRKLMNAWDTMYPVTADECARTKRIEGLQGNENLVVKQQCIEADLW